LVDRESMRYVETVDTNINKTSREWRPGGAPMNG
jgi:hypothetical protein